MNDYEPVIGPDGTLAWESPEGELYEMSAADQQELRLLALEHTAAGLQGQDYDYDDDEDEMSETPPEAYNDAILEALEEEDLERGRRITSAEIERFATHVWENDGEYPDEEEWQPADLDDTEQRREWMSERVQDINNGDAQ